MLLTLQSKTAAHAKLETLINKGRESAADVIQHVLNNQPSNHIVRGADMSFRADDNTPNIALQHVDRDGKTLSQTIHRHALGQLSTTADMPLKFIDNLQSAPWGRELLAHDLQTIFRQSKSRKRFLLRSLNNDVRGVLSDHYRRLDSRGIVEAFATAVEAKGAMPYAGYVTDTRIAIQAVMPEVYEPIPGELVAYGLSLENSDFGNGALSLRAYLLRIWCSNLAITQEEMRQVHLGRRLDENTVYSQRTYELDAKTITSAIKDIVSQQLNADALHKRMEAIRAAKQEQVDPVQAHATLRKLLQKGEADDAVKAFSSTDDFNLPTGHSRWRLSNAVSWIAGQTADKERKLDLMKIAGQVLPKAA